MCNVLYQRRGGRTIERILCQCATALWLLCPLVDCFRRRRWCSHFWLSAAAVMGDNLTFFIGRRVGAPLLVWLERQKRFRWISPRAMGRGRTYFKRRAAWAIFITRFLIVALGGPINLLAGLERYPYRKFLFWDVSGQILSVIISLGLGYIFAASWEEAASLFGAFSSLFLVFLAAAVLSIVLVRKVRQRKYTRTADAEASEELQTIENKAKHTTNPLSMPGDL